MSGNDAGRGTPNGFNEGAGVSILSTLLSGLLLYGVLGWLIDRLLNTSFVIVIGLVVGLVLSLYLIIKRYGSFE